MKISIDLKNNHSINRSINVVVKKLVNIWRFDSVWLFILSINLKIKCTFGIFILPSWSTLVLPRHRKKAHSFFWERRLRKFLQENAWILFFSGLGSIFEQKIEQMWTDIVIAIFQPVVGHVFVELRQYNEGIQSWK